MRKKIFYFGSLIAITIVGLLWYLLRVKSQTSINEKLPMKPPATLGKPAAPLVDYAVEDERKRENKLWNMWFATPIIFYGKVVDEKGSPISGADVDISFADHVSGGNTKSHEMTDIHGLFNVSGHGLSVVVMVSKNGYYRMDDSSRSFGYSNVGGKTDQHTDPKSPAIFVLRKVGKVEPLIKIDEVLHVPKDGTPVEVNLTTGRIVPSGQGDFKVEVWANDGNRHSNLNGRFDWHCRISVVGGGLTQGADGVNFEAPVGGYVPEDDIDMPMSLGQKWENEVAKNYFLKISGDRYARIEFHVISGGNQLFQITSYLNPQAGSRNLEYGQNAPGTAP